MSLRDANCPATSAALRVLPDCRAYWRLRHPRRGCRRDDHQIRSGVMPPPAMRLRARTVPGDAGILSLTVMVFLLLTALPGIPGIRWRRRKDPNVETGCSLPISVDLCGIDAGSLRWPTMKSSGSPRF